MQVQESKGLEFDDVLLYNFFTDSEAKDLWRIVSNYTEEDVRAYYEDQTVLSSGVQTYDWDYLLEGKARPLSFCREEHKILETELKMLYVSITRARVNVFIAETDAGLSRPMFEYFKRRCVVDVANSDHRNDIEGVRVFGKMSSIEDWRKRGEYYLGNAEGQRRKGCLRLAAKCFDKAGDYKRREYALAFLAFIEETEEEDLPVKKKRDKAAAKKERLYQIANQLLETEDVVFLDKAAFCLLKVGGRDLVRSAEMFELFSQISYAKRKCKDQRSSLPPSTNEQQYFSYAAKLFEKSSRLPGLSDHTRQCLLMRSIRNFMSSASGVDLANAAKLIDNNTANLNGTFRELFSLCSCTSEQPPNDPIVYFQNVALGSKAGKAIGITLNKLAKVACRTFYNANDRDGVEIALQAIHSRSERIQVLSSLEGDPAYFVSQVPWASHSIYSNVIKSTKNQMSKPMNSTEMLVSELIADGEFARATEILEERGMLLDAADLQEKIASESGSEALGRAARLKAAEIRSRYVELVLAASQATQNRDSIQGVLQAIKNFLKETDKTSLPDSLPMRVTVMEAKLTGSNLWDTLELCKKSALWSYDAILFSISSDGSIGRLLARPALDLWDGVMYLIRIVRSLQKLATALKRAASTRPPEEKQLVMEAESYYDLKPHRNPAFLSTSSVTNLKFREAVHEEGEDLLNAPVSRDKLLVEVSRKTVHDILAKHLYRKAISLLLRLENHISEQSTKSHPCRFVGAGMKCKEGEKCRFSHELPLDATANHILLLQTHVFCLEQMHWIRQILDTTYPDWPITATLRKRCGHRKDALLSLTKYLLSTYSMRFEVADDDVGAKKRQKDDSTIVWRSSILRSLSSLAHDRWYRLRPFDKKINLMEVIQLWRVLQFCDNTTNAREKVGKMLENIERKQHWFKNDMKKDKRDYFLDQGVQSARRVKLLSHMWIYAVEKAEDADLFQSMNMIRTLIFRTTRLDGLKTPSKSDLITMLEVNAIAVFSAISLRFSHSSSAKTSCLFVIPEKCYLLSNIVGNDSRSFRGFGKPIQNVISAACHKDFFECFTRCISQLEFIAHAIVETELLRLPIKPSPDDIERFEGAIVLSSFICCNAVSFSISGLNMSPKEAQDEPNSLPAIPLCGKIAVLVRQLTIALSNCQSASLRIQKCFRKFTKENPNFLDLMQGTKNLLQNWRFPDRLVLCRLKEADEDNVEIVIFKETDHIESTLRSVPFHPERGIFLRHYKPKAQQILSNIEGETEDDVVQSYSREADEQNAASTIVRYLRSWNRAADFEAAFARFHFRRWRRIIRSFTGVVKRRMRTRVKAIEEESKVQMSSDRWEKLSDIPDRWREKIFVHRTVEKWRENYTQFHPIFDGLECGFCQIVFAYPQYQARHQWCQQQVLQCVITYAHAAQKFNVSNYGVPQAPFGIYGTYGLQSFGHHAYEESHKICLAKYQSYYQKVSHVAANLDISYMTIYAIVQVCGYGQYAQNKAASFYLNKSEDARSWYAELDRAHKQLVGEGLLWPPSPNFEALMLNIMSTCSRIQCFFEEICEEETRLINECVEDQHGEGMVSDQVQDDYLSHPLADFKLA